MTENYQVTNIHDLPNEILLHIFKSVQGAHLIRCRRVCLRWKYLVDHCTKTDEIWKLYCQEDFKDIYKTARQKAQPSLSWRHLYRSLYAWPRIKTGTEEVRRFAHSHIKSINIRNGVIAVHKVASILYYESERLVQTKRIIGHFRRYEENDKLIVFMHYVPRDSNLRIAPKDKQNGPLFDSMVSVADVTEFILVYRTVYYIRLKREVHVCKFSEKHGFTRTYLNVIDDDVVGLSYSTTKSRLHVLTKRYKIYTFTGRRFVLSHAMTDECNFLHVLNEYNIINRFGYQLWRMYYMWIRNSKNNSLPPSLFWDITAVCVYGDVVFIGTGYGILKLYHTANSKGELDIVNTKPVKEFDLNLLFSRHMPVSFINIKGIDVMETENGHSIIVSTIKRIFAVDINYNFTGTSKAPISDAVSNE